MSPKEIAQKVIEAAENQTRFPGMFKDELAKEIARVITEERNVLSQYLNYLNQSIAHSPELVRHRLLIGSSRITTGHFCEDMTLDDPRAEQALANPLRKYYAR
jgi:hypothetical protein